MDSPLAPARERLGLTQAQMGTRCGVDATTISRWELNKQRPDPVLTRVIAECYELDEHIVGEWIASLTRSYASKGRRRSSVNERLERLEQAVAELRREVDLLRGSGGPPTAT